MDYVSPWNSPGQNTGVGSLSLLQGIFPSLVRRGVGYREGFQEADSKFIDNVLLPKDEA